ncbi:MAG TPA: DUF2249 domain-containing protein [Oscillatoriaceae cyanobacterium]
MTSHQTVPRSHWATYLQALSERYQGQPVALSQERHGAPTQTIAQGLYFAGISLEGGEHPALLVQMSRLDHPEAHLSHRVALPTLMLREEESHRAIARLVIEDAQHDRTVLDFQEPQSPGPRRLAAKLDRVQCDHPRCPLDAPSHQRLELDVRHYHAEGREPFGDIMATVARLGIGDALVLHNTFEPAPLYAVLGRKGFEHASQQIAEEHWIITFTRVEPSVLGRV